MSSPPTKYIKSYDYAATPPLNVDFDRVKVTTDQTIDRLALIQRDDGGLKDGLITTASLADGSVTEPKLADLSVSTRTLQDLSVTTPKLADASVTTAKLGINSVDSNRLAPLSVQTGHILDFAVTTPKLADASVTSSKLGPSLNLTGVPTAPTAITGTNTTQIATTAFVAASMSAAGMITEAPNDGLLYGRFALGWQRGVALAGDAMTGLLLLSADPAAPLGAATKQYVDAAALTLSTGKVSKAGDTMTGNLGIGRAPDAWDAGNKALVLGAAGSVFGAVGNAGVFLGSNLYYDGANWKLISAGGAGMNGSGGGTYTWYTAPAGAAGANAVLTERLRLDINGFLGVGVVPAAWGAAYKALQLGPTAALYASNAGGQLVLSSNSYFNGASHIRQSANPVSALSLDAGQFLLYYSATGAAGSVAPFTETLRVDTNGQLYNTASRGSKRHTTKDHVAANNQVTAFKWPIELSNFSCSVRVKVTASNDDGNTGYTSVYREIVGNYSCFAGAIVFAGMIQVAHHPQSVNAGVCGINVAVGLVQSPPGQMNLTVTPLSSGSTGISTARITCSMELIGIDDYQAIQAFTGSA